MQRESDQHSPRADDELKAEMQGMLKGGGPTHAEEWADPEPPADDDPDVAPFTTRSDELGSR
jgi:hypothetical protein